MEKVWKDIPGFDDYQCSQYGDIRKKLDQHEYQTISPYYTKQGYVRVNLWVEGIGNLGKLVHQLTCLTFNGPPPESGHYEVNHKNGIKDDNNYTNLEWMTSKENVNHAIEAGLTRYNIRIRMFDTLTGECRVFISMRAAADFFGTTVEKIKRFLRLPDSLVEDRYRLEPILDEHVPASFSHTKEIKAKDYISNKIIIASNGGVMSLVTGVSAATILKHATKDTPTLVGGYVFMFKDDNRDFPEHTPQEAYESRKRLFDRNIVEHGVLAKNHATGEVVAFKSQTEAEKVTGVNSNSINTILNNRSLIPFKGFSIKRPSDDREFPVYDQDQIKASLIRKARGAEPFKVMELDTGNKTYHPSLKDLAKHYNLSRSAVRQWINKYPDKPYRGKYVIKGVSL